MHLRKRTYSIEEQTLRAFEKIVDPGNRSNMVTRLLRQYLEEREREAIRKDLMTGLPEMAELYLEETKAWYPLEEEVYEKATRTSRTRTDNPSRIRPRKRT